jgi:hypothetical protein
MVLSFLNTLDEFRDLSLEKWNFRVLVQDHLGKLLEQQRVYWKRRGDIKWATLGDENTKFFHANATVMHNRGAIRSLKDSIGHEHFKHEHKALILWESFKERLGTSNFSHMYFDLHDILIPVDNLDELVEPFRKEEIDVIITELKTDKSLGPDGFNTNIMKKSWPIICNDFYDLYSEYQ